MMGTEKLREPYYYRQTTVLWNCGAPECKTGHVDQKRAENCPKRKRALRRAAFMSRIPV